MPNIGIPEILIILFVILFFFGGKKLPEIAKNLGKGIKEFRKEIKSIQNTVEPLKKELK
ncbi:MAG: twin-arginine translocase TatA/TatE family subunit [Ignavibacteria bacterium]|nr:MAG: twin-arginine translocase TatA/TatE family subunit [Ignavibacteria bacterium]